VCCLKTWAPLKQLLGKNILHGKVLIIVVYVKPPIDYPDWFINFTVVTVVYIIIFQLFVQCQKMGFCLSHCNHFASNTIDKVHLGNELHGTGNNWDMKIRPHDMLSTHQNTELLFCFQPHCWTSPLRPSVHNVTSEWHTFVAKLNISHKFGGCYKAEGGF
jgi:hypothetical protein